MSVLMGWLTPIRSICLWIDCVAFSLVDNAYNIFATLATNEVISSDAIVSLRNNIYILVGIIALFRMAVFLITSILTPDKFTTTKDSKGISSLFLRLIFMLCAIVLSPWIFDQLSELQATIVNDNIIMKLFLPSSGKDIDSDNLSSNFTNAGKTMQKIVITSLIKPDEQLFGTETSSASEREEYLTYYLNYEFPDTSTRGPKFLKDLEENSEDAKKYHIVVREECRKKKACLKALSQYHQMIMQSSDGGFKLRRLTGYIGGSLEMQDPYNLDDEGDTEDVYYYEYSAGLTTISAIFLTYVILSWGIDIAVRSVEIAVLEVLSPLFMATIVVPESKYFNNWLKRFGKTYVDLFIKLGTIAIAILLLSLVQDMDIWRTVTEGVISLW
ncbi:MAG: hypothetical protein MR296_00910 [Tenericutes bacterium]|nr:hypothetical protein [Mycoplasmatota bacterium]